MCSLKAMPKSKNTRAKFRPQKHYLENPAPCRSARRFGGHFDTMATNTKQYGPNGVRMERIQLTLLDTESERTGFNRGL